MRHFIVICFALIVIAVQGQAPIRFKVTPEVPPDTADLNYYGKKHFFRAVGEVVGLNMGLWAFDRFVTKGDYAYISLHSIKENFKHGFKWDNDCLGDNMFLHPYHGNLYFNAARSNGYNYWQSGLFAIGGSAMWEMFMECEYPSTNDIIATPIGGMAIGEVMFRASDIVLKDNSTGWERAGREAAAFLISPMRGLTRLLTGDMWKRRRTTGRLFGTPNVAIEMSTGVRWLEFRDKVFDEGLGGTFLINIEYGDRFEVRSSKPYDYFNFSANLNFQKGQPVLGQLNIKGRLIARELLEDKKTYMSIGMYQHFDYYDSDTISDVTNKVPYKFGTPASVGMGVLIRDIDRKYITVDAFAHTNAVILGAVLSDHYKVDQRNYNLASGFSIKAGINMVVKKDKFSLSAEYDYYRLFTWKTYARNTNLNTVDYRTINVQGDKSAAYFAVTNFRASYKLWKRLYLTAMFTMYNRSTHYRDYDNVHSTTTSTRLMLTYKL
ncbi:MAG: DUF3943 domain-containing protein [Bacteroidales bacterium]|nr:DUF3943 domain-containing protein [Bacteroidales bacterium]